MRKVWLVVKREYLVRIRTKGFIFTTIGLPVLSAGVMIFSMMMATREADHTLKIALLDDASFAKIIAAGFTEKLKNGQPVFQLVRTLEQPQSDQKVRDELADQVRRGLLIIVAAFILYPAVMRDPASRLSVVVSLLPFLSPILMTFRIALQTPPLWQIALSLALSIATTVGVVYVAAKIYRVGILMYGKRPSLVELLRWLKYT